MHLHEHERNSVRLLTVAPFAGITDASTCRYRSYIPFFIPGFHRTFPRQLLTQIGVGGEAHAVKYIAKHRTPGTARNRMTQSDIAWGQTSIPLPVTRSGPRLQVQYTTPTGGGVMEGVSVRLGLQSTSWGVQWALGGPRPSYGWVRGVRHEGPPMLPTAYG